MLSIAQERHLKQCNAVQWKRGTWRREIASPRDWMPSTLALTQEAASAAMKQLSGKEATPGWSFRKFKPSLHNKYSDDENMENLREGRFGIVTWWEVRSLLRGDWGCKTENIQRTHSRWVMASMMSVGWEALERDGLLSAWLLQRHSSGSESMYFKYSKNAEGTQSNIMKEQHLRSIPKDWMP